MFLFDTDIISLAFQGQQQVSKRLSAVSPTSVYVSSISVEEELQGFLAGINRARSRPSLGIAAPSLRLVEAVKDFARLQLLAYDDEAERLFQSFPASVRRVGGMDCRIAAHAIVSGLVAVTRNTRDFSRIPGVQTEDWSV